MIARLVGTALALLILAGCGGGDDTKKIEVSGRVHLDNLSSVKVIPDGDNATHGCVVPKLAGKNVIITDPNGKKVAVAELPPTGLDDPLPAEDADKYLAGAPGTCNLTFEVSVSGGAGVYTAEVEGAPETQTSFTEEDADTVLIEVPDGS